MSGPAPYPLPRKDALILRDSALVIERAACDQFAAFGGIAGHHARERYTQYCRLAAELRRIAGPPPNQPAAATHTRALHHG